MKARLSIAAAFFLSASLAYGAATKIPEPKKEPDIAVQDADIPPPENNVVVLQGLNKVTGTVSKLEGPTGTVLRFGNLEIVAHRCWKASPEERPENAALLDISELKAGEPPARIFLGWMFSSSPGLSGLEHAVYDVNVLDCQFRKDPEKSIKDKNDKAPPEKSDKPEKKK